MAGMSVEDLRHEAEVIRLNFMTQEIAMYDGAISAWHDGHKFFVSRNCQTYTCRTLLEATRLLLWYLRART